MLGSQHIKTLIYIGQAKGTWGDKNTCELIHGNKRNNEG